MQHLLDVLLGRFLRTNLILWRGGFQTYKNFSQRFHLLSDDRTLPTQYQMHPQEQLFCRWKLYIHLFRQKWFTLNLQLAHGCSPDNMQNGKANHHAPLPLCQFVHWTSNMCRTFLFKRGYLVRPWIVQSCFSLIFRKGERNSCFSFSWNYTKSSFKASGIW